MSPRTETQEAPAEVAASTSNGFDFNSLTPVESPAAIERKKRASAVDTGPFKAWVQTVVDLGPGNYRDVGPIPREVVNQLVRNLRLAASQMSTKRFSVKDYPYVDPNDETHTVSETHRIVRYGIRPEPTKI